MTIYSLQLMAASPGKGWMGARFWLPWALPSYPKGWGGHNCRHRPIHAQVGYGTFSDVMCPNWIFYPDPHPPSPGSVPILNLGIILDSVCPRPAQVNAISSKRSHLSTLQLPVYSQPISYLNCLVAFLFLLPLLCSESSAGVHTYHSE